MRRTLVVLAALLVTLGSAEARVRKPHRGTPIIAGDSAVRVTRSGNVVAPVMHLRRRDINGRAHRPRHRLGPG